VLQRAGYAVAALLVAVALFGLRAAVREVPHRPAVLANGAPAVVYAPPTLEEGVRVPVVVLAHGRGGNARGMSSLARRIARAGYGVVSFDFHGHGEHPERLQGMLPGTRESALRADVDAALLLARTEPRFDPERVALAGHSMGGSAAMDTASFDPAIVSVVAISGSQHWNGPYAPANLLLIWASGDPMTLRREAEKLAAERAQLQQVVLDRLYGDPARGSAVKASEVDGTNHVSIVYSADAAERIVAWLGRTLGPGAAAAPYASDGRFGWCALGLAASLALLWGLAGALGRVVPRIELPDPRSPAAPLAAFVIAQCAGVLLAAGADPELARGTFGVVPLGTVREPIGAFACAGLMLLAWSLKRGDISLAPLRDVRIWASALLVAFASYLLVSAFLEPFGLVWPTPLRLFWIGVGALLLLPYFAGCELLLRVRGATGRWLPALARLLALAALFAGAALGALPASAQEAAAVLVPIFAALEVAAQRLASRAPNPWFSGLLQSAWVSGALCAGAPLLG
jgi:dienelactone hydrolase